MLIWDNARKLSQKLAQDNSQDAADFLDMMMNTGYKSLLQQFQRQYTEQTATSILKSNRRGFQAPPDCLRPKMLTLLQDTRRWPLTEVPSDKMWSQRKENELTGQPTGWHYSPRFGIGGGILELDPVPVGADYSLEMIYEATERDLSNLKYTTGTIAITNASDGAGGTVRNVVIGTGTTFTADMVGRYLRPTGANAQRLYYRIGGFTSATQITLEQNYQGLDLSGANFEIVEIFALPEDMHVLPVFYAVWMWWSTKGNPVRTAEHETNYKNGLKEAKANHALATVDPTFESPTNWPVGIFGDPYPSNFPLGVEG